ncbi:MAG: leucyl/phenylalanyl-tRNA--protein transferase [Proteobacteria bacterium]|nr:leucyl/phenylalanyl-tRNA--protein transferase [Pseudomonadota bacterium]
MTVFLLSENPSFPPPYLAEENGLLAIGGDLSEKRLIQAYKTGIFPWYAKEDPILWWSPEKRLVLFPDELRISKSLGKTLRKKIFNVTFDQSFEQVITSCAETHIKKDKDTWIVNDMIAAYIRLYESGYAHSMEARLDGELAGGLYGVAIGKCFFGESMFTAKTNASKVAFVVLVKYLKDHQFHFIDCQLKTDHLMRFGAKEISRKRFMKELSQSISSDDTPGKWHFDLNAIYPDLGTQYALQ